MDAEKARIIARKVLAVLVDAHRGAAHHVHVVTSAVLVTGRSGFPEFASVICLPPPSRGSAFGGGGPCAMAGEGARMARVRRAVLGMEDARDPVAKVALSVQRVPASALDALSPLVLSDNI